jgi:hypothetical protein
LGSTVTENLFDKIHADPRWLPFLRKAGKAPEQLVKIEFQGDAAAGGRRNGERRLEQITDSAMEPREICGSIADTRERLLRVAPV